MNFDKIKAYFENFDLNTFMSSLMASIMAMSTEGLFQIVNFLIAAGVFHHNLKISRAKQALEEKKVDVEIKKTEMEIKRIENEIERDRLSNDRYEIETETLSLNNKKILNDSKTNTKNE